MRPDTMAWSDGPIPDATQGFGVNVGADFLSVRAALVDVLDHCQRSEVPDDARGTLEIVLAEVLNNIVEHAQAGRPTGQIDLALSISPEAIGCRVRDDGHPMPGGALPAGKLRNYDSMINDLPEGGFGWHLIRQLTSEINYERRDSWNQTEFVIAVSDVSEKPHCETVE